MSEIVFNPPASEPSLRSQIDGLQTTLASLNQQVIFLQEAIQEKDLQIADLQKQLAEAAFQSPVKPLLPDSSQSTKLSISESKQKTDNTLTLVGLLITLYKFAFPTLNRSGSGPAGKV